MLSWLKNLRQHFIDDCNVWYKRWSTWLAVVWGIIGVIFWNIPTWLPELVANLPSEIRVLLSPVVMLLLTGLPILITQLKQANLQKKSNGQ